MDWSARRDYLVGKLLQGCAALDDLAGIARYNEVSAHDAERIANRYDLLPKQRTFLRQTAERIRIGQEVVEYLEEALGVDEDGRFYEPKRLHRILGRKRGDKDVEAQSYGFAIGFAKPTLGNDTLGLAFTCAPPDAKITTTLIEVALGTNRPKRVHVPIFYVLTMAGFRAYSKDNYQTLTSRQLDAVAQDELEKTVTHELRHIMDGYLLKTEDFSEAQAYLYEGEGWRGVEKDKRTVAARLARKKNICDSDNVVASANMRDSLKLLDEQRNVFMRGEASMLSYFFSQTPMRKAGRRAELISDMFADRQRWGRYSVCPNVYARAGATVQSEKARLRVRAAI